MRAANLVVGHAKKRSPSESIFPFRWLALPPSRLTRAVETVEKVGESSTKLQGSVR
jgi:hypothetical protein